MRNLFSYPCTALTPHQYCDLQVVGSDLSRVEIDVSDQTAVRWIDSRYCLGSLI